MKAKDRSKLKCTSDEVPCKIVGFIFFRKICYDLGGVDNATAVLSP